MITGIVVVLAVIGATTALVMVNHNNRVAAANKCTYTAADDDTAGKNPGLPPAKKAKGTHTATIALSQGTYSGTVKVDLDPKAPCTVNSFEHLASKKFFDGTTCHRETATDGLSVLQCGDPTGTGSGGPGYTIPDENLAGATYPAGTVAMANAGANTGGSQFFLVYKDSQLPPSYTPFGKITSGLDVLTTIAAVGQNNANGTGDGAPNVPVTITSLTVGS